mmetsp:Transcript_13868/g.20940  ORF Transcript_13868/g.20940 Transcript_13868/m.20940 type:complete len:82 (-) Transcript_13868:147-392(-)
MMEKLLKICSWILMKSFKRKLENSVRDLEPSPSICGKSTFIVGNLADFTTPSVAECFTSRTEVLVSHASPMIIRFSLSKKR